MNFIVSHLPSSSIGSSFPSVEFGGAAAMQGGAADAFERAAASSRRRIAAHGYWKRLRLLRDSLLGVLWKGASVAWGALIGLILLRLLG